MKQYTADLETTTNPLDCRVWAWAIEDIESKEWVHGNIMDTMMEQIVKNGTAEYYFHNLKFDGDFIISWLFNHGYKHVNTRKVKNKEFSTLISDKGSFYKLTVGFYSGKKICHAHIMDSLKLIPFSVAKIGEDFNLGVMKGEIDYHKERCIGHVLDEEELAYLHNDVDIMARALDIFKQQGLNGMTIGANALNFYKNMIGKKKFDRRFPNVDYDLKIRQSYKGGWTFLKPGYEGKEVGEGIVLDVNSLYPYVLHACPLPYGHGLYYTGEYKKDKYYPLYIQTIRCEFKLKEGHLPTIQMKGTAMFKPTEYLDSSRGETVTLCLTNVDLELFFDQYHVYNVEYLEGYKFRSASNMFKEYVEYWMARKIEAEKLGNMAMRAIAKLYLNNLYGKFAKNPRQASKIPYMQNGVVKYKTLPPEDGKGVYIPVGSFVTAYARNITIRAAQDNYERFVYADTDSLHLLGTELPEGLNIDKFELGAWKHESTFTRAKFLRAKCYMEDQDGKLEIRIAGLPQKARLGVKFDNFDFGSEYEGKTRNKRVPGGIVLMATPFKIKESA